QKALEDALKQSNTDLAQRQEQLEKALAELRAAQQQLVDTKEALTTARLAHQTAQEIRNPLQILQAGLDALSGDDAPAAGSSSAAILEEMRTAIRRADDVIEKLMRS
ncbi:MAG TPA: hypothetical protein VFD27_12810, partial [Chthoniobacteraceae bacterium]|nr:hypothetical protein [Chthoniobacteraceae bacterium]